ncbi:MAG: hypothetical protein DME26_20780, partial [Verrucomicrobia bacterium]
RVLELDGTNSFVELPAGAFTNLDEVTVEGWVKWESFGSMSRFFDFTLAGYELNVMNRATDPALFVETLHGNDRAAMLVTEVLSLGRWTHIAAAVGTNTIRLFVDGALISSNLVRGQFPTAGLEKRNLLGRSNFKAVYTTDADFRGQMDEVRVWNGLRTEAQIRENMFKNLTGKEAGLVGLWNFNDGSANDSTSAAHHGTPNGQAKIVEATLPSASALVPWSRVMVQLTDASGAPLQNVTIRAEVNGAEVGRATSAALGYFPLTVWTTERAVDLVAIATNDLGGWRFAFPVTPYTEQTNIWKLGPAIHLAGRAVALDGKTPHSALVVELVEPDDASPGPTLTDRSADAFIRAADSTALPHADVGIRAPADTNRVLQLDGKSYLELPPNIFKELTEATIEAWIKWDRLVPGADLFDFGIYNS